MLFFIKCKSTVGTKTATIIYKIVIWKNVKINPYKYKSYGNWLFAVKVALNWSPTSRAKHSFGFGVGLTNNGSWSHVQLKQLITLTRNWTGMVLSGVMSWGFAKSSTWRATAKSPIWLALYDSIQRFWNDLFNIMIYNCFFYFFLQQVYHTKQL